MYFDDCSASVSESWRDSVTVKSSRISWVFFFFFSSAL